MTASPPIRTIDGLQEHLRDACIVELSTIPMYLYGLYSIQSQIEPYSALTANAVPGLSAHETIRSIVIEEMLHLTLARNMYMGVGGTSLQFYDPTFVPKYPAPMLARVPKLELLLAKVSDAQLDRFLAVEKPEKRKAPPESGPYHTIGQFYAAIEQGIEWLDANQHDALWKDPRVGLQLDDDGLYWNQSGKGSGVFTVGKLEDAQQVIAVIVGQGEGSKPHDDEYKGEYSHYEKFALIKQGLDQTGVVWNMVENPDPEQYGPDLRRLAELFDAAYCYSLLILDNLYATETGPLVADRPNRKWGLIQALLTTMGGVLSPIALALVRRPLGAAADSPHAGPAFRYYEYGSEDPKQVLMELVKEASSTFPELGGDDSVQRLIGRLPPVTVVR
jgi:hypothetical protein